MSKAKFFIIFAVMMALGLVGFYLIRLGFYPAAFVNSGRVSSRDFREALASVGHYYSQLLKTLPPEKLETLPPPASALLELRRSTLDKIIGDILVLNEVKAVTGAELETLVRGKIESLKIQGSDFKEAVNSLYGLTPERFKELVLIPEARREILEDRLKESKTDFNDWILKARQSARVVILTPKLRWDGEKVVVR